MKKLLTLLLVFPFLFAACSSSSDNDEKTPEEKAELIGNWSKTLYSYKVQASPEAIKELIEEDLKENETFKYSIEFKADGSGYFISKTEEELNSDLTFTYKFEKDIITLVEIDEEDDEAQGYTPKVYKLKVIELSDKALKLELDATEKAEKYVAEEVDEDSSLPKEYDIKSVIVSATMERK